MSLAGDDFYRMGLGLLNEGNAPEALHQLRLAEKELPDRYDVMLALGRALVILGEGDEAESYYRRCIESDPNRPQGYEQWAELCRKRGQKEEEKRMAALARVHGGGKPETDPKAGAAWSPDASAPKAGDLWFFCPNCDAPIRRGFEELACPSCRFNLIPLLHGHIRPQWSLEGDPEYRCRQCSLQLTGKEMTCPHCGMNLLTGALPNDENPMETVPVKRRFKSRSGLISLAVGILLLTVGIGQWREPGRPHEIRLAWTQIVQRVTAARETVPAEVATRENQPMDVSVESDNEMLSHFWRIFGMVLLGSLALAFGLLKMALDK